MPNHPSTSAMSSQRPTQKRQVSLPYSSTAIAPPSFPSRHGSSILIDCRSEDPSTVDNDTYFWSGKKLTNRRQRQATSIDMLPDDVLLEIFHFYVDKALDFRKDEVEEWQTLVHVCRRWRRVVFGSPRRLNLRLVCTPETPARDTLDVWPSLPLHIRDSYRQTEDVDEIIAVLERCDRVVKIYLYNFIGSGLENILATMEVPFPELTRLSLTLQDGMVSVLPDSFLGGSAPRLESPSLIRIPFPGLPKLLLSATHLVKLTLADIPHSGYFSPEEMVSALSTLPRLDYLSLQFESPRSLPDRHPPPLTRSVLHVLIAFQFKGVCEYLEDIMAGIDAPRLKNLEITLFNQIISDTPQSIQFISRTPMLERFEKALVVFRYDIARVILSSQTSGYGKLNVQIPCIELDWQVSSMEQICTSCLPPLSSLEDLYIYEDRDSWQVWQGNIENALLLELLQPFTTVKNLYLSEKFASRIMPALQELVGGRTTEVLPILQNIFLDELQPSGTVQACIQHLLPRDRSPVTL